MSYDRADWHYGGNFPADLPPQAGGTHIGMFLAWAIGQGLEGELHREDSAESLKAVRERRMTGRDFLMRECDEKFVDEDLNDEGNAFTVAYYEKEGPGSYLADYEDVFGATVSTLYHVEDTWSNYDKLAWFWTGVSPSGGRSVGRVTPDNKRMQLTKPAQAMELRS